MHHFILVVKWVCKVPILDIDMKTLMQEDSSLLLVSSFVMFQTQFVGYNHSWFNPLTPVPPVTAHAKNCSISLCRL